MKKLFGLEPQPKFVLVKVRTEKKGDEYIHPLTFIGDHPLAREYRQRLQEHNIQQMQMHGSNEHESYVLLR